ncbi:MAG: pyridoxamine 5'-phosphate oxidase family protein [Ilumatobacteraceae bacterium]
MQETAEDLIRVQRLLDESYQAAGTHLREVITPERMITAKELSEKLLGMRLLVLSTVTKDCRPIGGPVDGIFYRGDFYFGSSPVSTRFLHIKRGSHVTATHLPGEELSVTVHGSATPIDIKSTQHSQFRQTLLDIYVPRYGKDWEKFLDSGPLYGRINARRMFVFFMPPT